MSSNRLTNNLSASWGSGLANAEFGAKRNGGGSEEFGFPEEVAGFGSGPDLRRAGNVTPPERGHLGVARNMSGSLPQLNTVGEDSPTSTMLRSRRYSRQTGEEDHGFRLEDGTETSITTDRAAFMSNIILENPETETRWYFRYFLTKFHQNFVAFLPGSGQTDMEPVMLSVLNDDSGSIRAILWRKTGSERLLTKGARGKSVDPKKVIQGFGHGTPDRRIQEVKDPAIQQDLLRVEEQEGAVNFKIGVLFAAAGQTTDDEMFSNNNAPPDFEQFYKCLGEYKALKGHQGYRGGLDVNNDTTGTHSVHTIEFGKEIMYHIATLLPFSKDNMQQLERKRHLGNDICNIIYQEDARTEFNPEAIRSKFNHIHAVVSPIAEGYTLKVYSRNTVPEFGPPLPNPCIFSSLEELRHFLIVKLLNGEKAALGSPVSSFARKKERTLEMLISGMHSSYDKSQKRTLLRGSPKKSSIERAETFRAAGQQLKVSKIAAGVAPTSTRGEGGGGSDPWMPICITSKLPTSCEHIAGDSWESDFVISSTTGVSKLTVGAHQAGELELTQVTDSTVLVVQLDCDVQSGMLFFRTAAKLEEANESGKSGTVHAVALDVVRQAQQLFTKKLMKPFALPNTKGCNLYAVNKTSSSTASMLRGTCKVAVALGKKIRTFQFLAKNPAQVPGMGSGGSFVQLNEYVCSDQIEHLAVTNAGGNGLICAAFKSGEFVTIDVSIGVVTPIAIGNSVHASIFPVAVAQVGDPDDEEVVDFMLSYNQVSCFRDGEGTPSRDYDVRWTSRPHAVAYVYPYLLGFTESTVEVATMINGSLVKTMDMPGCQFLCNRGGIYFLSHANGQTLLYKMSEEALTGRAAVGLGVAPAPTMGPGNVFARRMSEVTLTGMRGGGVGAASGHAWGGNVEDAFAQKGAGVKSNPLFTEDE